MYILADVSGFFKLPDYDKCLLCNQGATDFMPVDTNISYLFELFGIGGDNAITWVDYFESVVQDDFNVKINDNWVREYYRGELILYYAASSNADIRHAFPMNGKWVCFIDTLDVAPKSYIVFDAKDFRCLCAMYNGEIQYGDKRILAEAFIRFPHYFK